MTEAPGFTPGASSYPGHTGLMDIPAELASLHKQTHAVFTKVHIANEATGQRDPELRQAMALTSAAVAALESAGKAAGRVREWGGGD